MQPGDVPSTDADINDLIADTGYSPKFSVQEGVCCFVKWYKEYYATS
jgi:UDP-glucuronate 4-epimerase